LNERIRKLRKVLDLTQQNFAKRIGSTQNVVANYEIGRRNPSSSVINNICKEFNVNENWFRTGEGEMFNKEKRFSLDEFLQKQEATDLEIEIVKLLFSFDKNTRGKLISKLKDIFQSETNISEFSANEKNSEKEKPNNQITNNKIENKIANYKSELSEKVDEKKLQTSKHQKYPIYQVPARGSETGYFEFEMTEEMQKGFEEDLNYDDSEDEDLY